MFINNFYTFIKIKGMLYKRKIYNQPATLWEKLYRPVCFLAASILALIFSSLEKDGDQFSYPLKKTVDETVSIVSNNTFDILNGAIITFKDISFLKSFVYPTKYFLTDRFYLLFAILICCMLIYLIYSEKKNGVFSNSILRYINYLTKVFIVMFILNTARWFYIQNKIEHATNDAYELYAFIDQFYRPEFWLMAVLGIITYILKKGEKLQEEQNLTV